MRFTVLIFLTCVSGGFCSDFDAFQSAMHDAMRVLVFGGQADDVAHKFLMKAKHIFGTDLNGFLDTPLDQRTSEKLDRATEQIATGIDTIMEEINLFQNSPAAQQTYEDQVRIPFRLMLSEAVKKLVQLMRIPIREIILKN